MSGTANNQPLGKSPARQTASFGPFLAVVVIGFVAVGLAVLGGVSSPVAVGLGLGIELIGLLLVVVYIQVVTTTRRERAADLIDIANRGEGQDELSEHDVPLGAPERRAVKAARAL